MGHVFKRGMLAGLAASLAILAIPLAAQAEPEPSYDIAFSQTASAKLVEPGESVTFTMTVTNRGTEASENLVVATIALRGFGQGADAPLQSFSASLGSCKDGSSDSNGYHYFGVECETGPIPGGASATLTAVLKVNESINQLAALEKGPVRREAVTRVSANTPPTVTGSKQVKLTGLPTGCSTGDFTIRATTKAKGVKKMSAVLELGIYTESGMLEIFEKVVRGNRLVAKVPASRLEPTLGVLYELRVKAKRGAAGPLTKSVTFQPC